jgi:cyclophilin family peptidyl-prolyl cis-trans isomerase
MRIRPLFPALVCSTMLVVGCGEKPKTESGERGSPAPAEPKASPTAVGEEVAVIETSSGKIILRFHDAAAPKTVAEFKRLAHKNFYDRNTFHRVIPGRLIQGGDPLSRDANPYNDGTGNSGIQLPAEFNKLEFKEGTVGLARGQDPNSGSCQFFICLARNRPWDGNYTAFAEVIDGIDVARRISLAQTNPKARMKERPIRDQTIERVRLERR